MVWWGMGAIRQSKKVTVIKRFLLERSRNPIPLRPSGPTMFYLRFKLENQTPAVRVTQHGGLWGKVSNDHYFHHIKSKNKRN